MTKSNPSSPQRFDSKEFQLPETTFIRDIDNRVFQNIIAQCLGKVRDVALVEGGFIDNIFGRSSVEGISGVSTEQDSHSQSLQIRVEVNIAYGVSIPDKAEEIQTKITEEITRLTGLHVASVHVVFKDLISPPKNKVLGKHSLADIESQLDEYSDEFK